MKQLARSALEPITKKLSGIYATSVDSSSKEREISTTSLVQTLIQEATDECNLVRSSSFLFQGQGRGLTAADGCRPKCILAGRRGIELSSLKLGIGSNLIVLYKTLQARIQPVNGETRRTARHGLVTELPLEYLELVLALRVRGEDFVPLGEHLLARALKPGALIELHFLVELGRAAFARLECDGRVVREMEGHWPAARAWQRRWRVHGERVEKVLERVRKYDFVVLPRVHGSRLGRVVSGRCVGQVWACGCPRMQLQVVVESDGALAGLLDECNLNLNLKLAPAVHGSAAGSRQ
jgi:hypothetical protein